MVSLLAKLTGRGGQSAAPRVEPVLSSAEHMARPQSAYMRGGRGVVMNTWTPALRDNQDLIGEAIEPATARAMDAICNSGWLSGAITQGVANTVGATGLRLKAMPENGVFGMTDANARAWAKNVEQRFGLWARDARECDIEGIRNFGQMQAAAFRAWFATGEILSELPYRKRGMYGTKVRLLPSQRLHRDSNEMRRLINGVYLDADGMPIGYRARRKDPVLGTWQDYDVAAYDRLGRRRVIHVFEGLPGTYRGIGPLTPALQVVRQFDQLSDATLTAAIVKTLFAATVTADMPTEETFAGLLTPQEQARMHSMGEAQLDAWMDASAGYYDSSTLNVGINGRVSHLFPGQKLELHTATSPGGDYEAFARMLQREFARCIGLAYDSATGDYNGSSYYSLGKSGAEIHAVTISRRENIIAPFCQPAYEAWLEEEVETGGISFPGGIAAFRANRAAACRAEWRGAPRPVVDDLKTAKADQILMQMGVAPASVIAAERGYDYEDMCQTFARDQELRVQYGVAEPVIYAPSGGAPIGGSDAIDD